MKLYCIESNIADISADKLVLIKGITFKFGSRLWQRDQIILGVGDTRYKNLYRVQKFKKENF